LTQNGSGVVIEEAGGTTTTSIIGGTSTVTVSDSGVRLSGSGDAPLVISNVADGVAANDAVNVRQLGALESKLSAGIAQSFAMSQLPALSNDATYSFGAAIGAFNGETAIAFGGSFRIDETVVIKGAASHSSAGETGGAIGIGWSW
jgi:autotransporter adhesin